MAEGSMFVGLAVHEDSIDIRAAATGDLDWYVASTRHVPAHRPASAGQRPGRRDPAWNAGNPLVTFALTNASTPVSFGAWC